MAKYALREVDPYAITIVKAGANRQRIFLRKEHAEPNVVMGGAVPLHKDGDDWSTFYCVVAQPGAEENGGLLAPDATDVWESEDEIRKAAHRLLKNRAFVNTTHEADAAPDCHIVESAVALDDFATVDPSGVAHTIQKGSWYVAIEPSAELRPAIEAGEIQAVSLEGSGVRIELEKADPKAQGTKGQDRAHANSYRICKSCGAKMSTDAAKCPSCGATYVQKAVETGKPGTNFTQVTPAARKKINPIVRHYMKDPHPFTACVRDNTKRFGPERAKKVCAVVKDMAEGTTKWRKGSKKVAKADPDEWAAVWTDAIIEAGELRADDAAAFADYMVQARAIESDGSVGLLRKMWGAIFPGEDEPAQLRKGVSDFDQRVQEMELRDVSWRAFDVLQSVINEAARDDSGTDNTATIRQSIEQFSAYLQSKLGGDTTALAKELATVGTDDSQEDDEVDEAQVKKIVEEQMQPLQKAQADTLAAITALSEKVTAAPAPKGDEKVTLEKAVERLGQVADKIDAVDGEVSSLAQSIRDLGSTQGEDRQPVQKSTDPLAGLLA